MTAIPPPQGDNLRYTGPLIVALVLLEYGILYWIVIFRMGRGY